MSSQGLTARDGCIDISASKVVLNTSRWGSDFSITGPGSTGIGIHLLPGANNNFIELDDAAIRKWNRGMMIEGDNHIFDWFQVQGNNTGGVELNNARGNNVSDFIASGNTNYGFGSADPV